LALRDDLLVYRREAKNEIAAASSVTEIDEVRVKYLGKKGLVSTVLRRMGEVSADERPAIGKLANDLREEVESFIAERLGLLQSDARRKALLAEQLDITLPGHPIPHGKMHVIQQVYEETTRIFLGMGYEIAEGPEVELDYYSFVALNIPKDHPARDMQATFYFDDEVVLRPHTSPVQIHSMIAKKGSLPVRLISPGKVYRRDSDHTHSPMFMQFEGLAVDTDVTLGDLKGTLETFAKQFFGSGVKIRLRPSYFPFTEPSAEVDVSCSVCGGKGCRVCKGTGWLEILGSGMVHPQVLRNGGYDPEKVQGFAFGMGVERIAMLKYGLDDMRQFYLNDMRFLRQF
jgi:phenylalanyl-tRNA synthetase alpha chain